MERKSPLQHPIKVIIYLLKRRTYLDRSSSLVFLHLPFLKDLFHLFCSQQNIYMKLEVNLLDKNYQKEETRITDYIVPDKPTSNRRDDFCWVCLLQVSL